MNHQRVAIIALLAAASLLPAPAGAHHGWAGNSAGEIEISGEVMSEVSLSGPHANFKLRDTQGQVWDITLAPAPRTYRAGLREGTIPVGAEVKVHGERNANPAVFEAKVRRVIWEDRVFDVYPPKT